MVPDRVRSSEQPQDVSVVNPHPGIVQRSPQVGQMRPIPIDDPWKELGYGDLDISIGGPNG